ncbi:Uncharacterised protein [Vibrio cholerae]|nr:Uncharacterised protein [Vibrio cholerae]CSD19324.1 Uncharacterised protein [Vibrio cholerae]
MCQHAHEESVQLYIDGSFCWHGLEHRLHVANHIIMQAIADAVPDLFFTAEMMTNQAM